MTTITATDSATQRIEALYRQEGERLWHALVVFAGDPEIASDAVAEAFAQVLRRGGSVREPRAWVWRAGFRIAAGELKKRAAATPTVPDVGHLDSEVDADLLDALALLPPKQRAAVVLLLRRRLRARDRLPPGHHTAFGPGQPQSGPQPLEADIG